MLNLTERDIQHAMDHMRDVHSRATRHAKMGEDVIGNFAAQGLSGLAAFGSGYVEGRYGPVKLGPLSADFLVGAVLHGGAFFGLFGAAGQSAHHFAAGLVDGYVHRLGMGLGYTQGQKATPPHAMPTMASPGGSFHIGGVTARSPVTEAEIAALVAKAR